MPGKADKKSLVFPVCFFFGAAAFYALNAYLFGKFDLWMGIVLLVGFVVYMIVNVMNMKKNPAPAEDADEHLECEIAEEESKGGLVKDIVMLVVSALVIAVGADLLVNNAIIVAEQLGVPQTIISLTVVALGTSLPELVTAITSLMKGHGALSLGNIIGANIFNLVLVSGASIALAPFEVPVGNTVFGMNSSLVIDIPLMLFVMAFLTLPALLTKKLRRYQGITLLALYAGFCVLQFVL
jgi:cation:H+ antiporter